MEKGLNRTAVGHSLRAIWNSSPISSTFQSLQKLYNFQVVSHSLRLILKVIFEGIWLKLSLALKTKEDKPPRPFLIMAMQNQLHSTPFGKPSSFVIHPLSERWFLKQFLLKKRNCSRWYYLVICWGLFEKLEKSS